MTDPKHAAADYLAALTDAEFAAFTQETRGRRKTTAEQFSQWVDGQFSSTIQPAPADPDLMSAAEIMAAIRKETR